MTTQMIVEGIGYLGSVLVVVAMLMTSVKKLRIINMVGSAIFAVYALIIRSYPTALMNFFLVGINIYNLFKLSRAVRNYRIIECYKDESIVQDLLRSFEKDIHRFFPSFVVNDERKLAFLVCSDSRPVGLMIGVMADDSTLEIELDYAIPEYRDCSVGSCLYDYISEHWKVTEFLFSVPSNNHEKYMQKVGYFKNENGKWELDR